MNFELGKQYIVEVTDKGIIPIEEFDREKYYNKDTDDLDFLTDEEKDLIVQSVSEDIARKLHDNIKKVIDDCCHIKKDENDTTVVARGILQTAEKNRNGRSYEAGILEADILFPPSNHYCNRNNNR